MKIERLKETNRMSAIVRHGGLIYLSGQTAADGQSDMSEQTRKCLEKVEALLGGVGATTESILTTLIHINDMNKFQEMNEVWDAWFIGKPKPARTCVQAQMARPEVLVELTVVAVDK